METNKSGFNYLWKGLWVGGFLGALAGFFLAPKSGRELKSDMKQKGIEAFDEAKKVYSETQSRGKAILEDAKQTFACLKGKAKTPTITESEGERVGEA